jgi:hypothetical protein
MHGEQLDHPRRVIYIPSELSQGFTPEDNSAWYRCDKWNLDCTCRLCKYSRQLIDERKRREQLKHDVFDNLRSWV